MTNRIRLSLLVGTAGLALVAALASTAAASPARTDRNRRAELRRRQDLPPRPLEAARHAAGRDPGALGALLRAREAGAVLVSGPLAQAPRRGLLDPSRPQAGVQPGAQGLRGGGGHHRRRPVARAVRRDHGLGHERGGRPADRGAVRPELPNGKVFAKPGNFFHALLEPTIWGTDARFVAPGGVKADLDGDGTVEFGEVLPDANVLVATARSFVAYARKSDAAARAWTPNASDVLTALVVMVPTVEGYFGEWKSSRAIAGASTKEKAFVAHSRLIDVHGILFSLQNVYKGVRPLVARAGYGAERADRHGAPAADAVRRRDLRAGEGRQEVHAEAGRPARAARPRSARTRSRDRSRRSQASSASSSRPESGRARDGDRVRELRRGGTRAGGGALLALAVVALVAALGAGAASAADEGAPWQAFDALDSALFDAELAAMTNDAGALAAAGDRASAAAERLADGFAPSAGASADAPPRRGRRRRVGAERRRPRGGRQRPRGRRRSPARTRRSSPRRAPATSTGPGRGSSSASSSRSPASRTRAPRRASRSPRSRTASSRARAPCARSAATFSTRTRRSCARRSPTPATRSAPGSPRRRPARRRPRAGTGGSSATPSPASAASAAAARLDRAFERLVGAARTGKPAATAAAAATVEDDLLAFRAAPLSPSEQARRAGQLIRYLGLVPGRVRTRRRERHRRRADRDPGGDRVPRRRRGRLRRPPVLPRRPRPRGDPLRPAGARRARHPARRRGARHGGRRPRRGQEPHEDRDARRSTTSTPTTGRRARPRPTSTSSRRCCRRSRRSRPPATCGAPSRAASRRTRPSSSAPSSASAASRRRCSSGSRGSSGTAPTATTASRSSSARTRARTSSRRRWPRSTSRSRSPPRRSGAGRSPAPPSSSNSAIIVFREGLEAVLILAALMASMVGAQRRFRRPLLAGVGIALVGERRDLDRRADRARLARRLGRAAGGGRLARSRSASCS